MGEVGGGGGSVKTYHRDPPGNPPAQALDDALELFENPRRVVPVRHRHEDAR